jgi:hypothetical protein
MPRLDDGEFGFDSRFHQRGWLDGRRPSRRAPIMGRSRKRGAEKQARCGTVLRRGGRQTDQTATTTQSFPNRSPRPAVTDGLPQRPSFAYPVCMQYAAGLSVSGPILLSRFCGLGYWRAGMTRPRSLLLHAGCVSHLETRAYPVAETVMISFTYAGLPGHGYGWRHADVRLTRTRPA